MLKRIKEKLIKFIVYNLLGVNKINSLPDAFFVETLRKEPFSPAPSNVIIKLIFADHTEHVLNTVQHLQYSYQRGEKIKGSMEFLLEETDQIGYLPEIPTNVVCTSVDEKGNPVTSMTFYNVSFYESSSEISVDDIVLLYKWYFTAETIRSWHKVEDEKV